MDVLYGNRMKGKALLKKSVLRMLGCFLLTEKDLREFHENYRRFIASGCPFCQGEGAPEGCPFCGYAPGLGKCMEKDGEKFFFVTNTKKNRRTHFAYKIAAVLGEKVAFTTAHSIQGFQLRPNWIAIWLAFDEASF